MNHNITIYIGRTGGKIERTHIYIYLSTRVGTLSLPPRTGNGQRGQTKHAYHLVTDSVFESQYTLHWQRHGTGSHGISFTK